MDLSQFVTDAPATRHDGWSPELRVKFLEHLSTYGNVRGACWLIGMSREAAYRLRRRDPLFARGWNAALAISRDVAADELGSRAIDGIQEDIWYRGEHVGTRTRYDNRLLLAHLARLDRLVEQSPAGKDTRRFDELLALVGGQEAPDGLPAGADGVPLGRDETVKQADHEARIRRLWSGEPFGYERENPPEWGTDANYDEERSVIVEEVLAAAGQQAALFAAAQWDDWFRRVCGHVDAVLTPADSSAGTVSNVSTSAAEQAPCHGRD